MLTIAFVVMIIGLLLYFAPFDPSKPPGAKINEVGRIMFMVGLFFVLWVAGSHRLNL